MVYRPKNIRTNFQMGEMPVENIVYSRLGGCFISFIQGIFFALVIVALATVACFFTYYVTNDSSQKSQMRTLNNFIDGKTAATKYASSRCAAQSIVPEKYIVAIQPKFDENVQPFTYSGAVYVTFITNVDNVESLQLQHNGVARINWTNVKIFRMIEQNDGSMKRSINETELLSDDEDSTTVESTTSAEAGEDVVTTAATAEATTAAMTITTSSAHKETTNGYASAQEVFSNYFLNYEDRNSEILIRDVVTDKFNDTITVRMRLGLRKNTLYVLKIEFEGNMVESGYGFLLSTYLDETETRRYFASTNSDSALAKPIFPTICHERNHQIPFDNAILRRTHWKTLTNSKLTKHFSYRINGIEWSLDIFQTTLPMRLCDFSIVVTQIAPTLITSARLTVYAYIREKKSPNFAIVDETLAKVASAFENITGIEYYMDRINLVGVPNNRQRSIAPGMIVASENDFVKPIRTADQLERIANAALLFAKLWYLPYAQYKNDYDLWLNDAMPLYLQWHALNNIYSTADDAHEKISEMLWLGKIKSFENDFDLTLIKSIRVNERGNYLTKKVNEYSTDRRRGFYLLQIIERLVEPECFLRAIRTHCKNINQNKESFLLELLQREIFEKSVDISLRRVIDTWLRRDSYPIVTASVDVQRNEILISQEELLSQQNSSNQRPFVLPLTIRNDPDELFFLTSNTVATRASNLIGNDSWLLLNTHGLGYYRSNYSPANWNAAIHAVHENFTTIDKFTRATLIDDAFNLARNGYLSYSIAFELVNASKGQETEYLAWKSMLDNLYELLEHTSDFCMRKIRKFTIDLISKTGERPIEIDDRLKDLFSRWSCALTLTACSNSSNEFYGGSEHVNKIIVAINPTVNDTNDIEKALKFVSCTSDLEVSTMLFNLIFKENMKRFVPNIIETCGRCKIGRKFILELFYEDMPRVLRATDIEDWLPLFERISSEFEYKMLQDIYTKYSSYFHPELKDAFKYIVARINSMVQWKRKIAVDCESIDWTAFA